MSFHNREFVRRTRRVVRQVVRSQPQLRREAKLQLQSAWTRQRDITALRWMVTLAFCGLAAGLKIGQGFWWVLALWATMLTFTRAGQFQQVCARGAVVSMGLPLSAQQVFEEGRRKCALSSLWLAADVFFGLVVAFGFSLAPSAAWWGVLPAAVLVWASVPATAVLLLWWRPQTNYSGCGSALLIVSGLSMFVVDKLTIVSTAQLDVLLKVLTSVTPTGWACEVAMWVVGIHPVFPVVSAGLLGFTLAGAVPLYRALQDRFQLHEADAPPVSRGETEREEALEENAAEDEFGPPIESRAAEVEERLIGGDFLRPLRWTGGRAPRWIERMIYFCLRKRVTVLDFVLGANPGWSGLYRFGWRMLGAGTMLAWLAKQWMPGLVWPIVGVSLFTAICCTTPLVGGQWPGLRLAPFGQRQVAMLALLPVSLREASRAIVAVNGIRFALALPCWLAAFAILAWFSGDSWAESVKFGAQWWLIALLWNPFFVMFKYSAGTNDSSSGCLMMLAFLAFCSVPIAALAWVLMAVFIPASIVWQIAGYVALAVACRGMEASYRWLYATKRFDVLAKGN